MFINFIDPECYCHKSVSPQFIEDALGMMLLQQILEL